MLPGGAAWAVKDPVIVRTPDRWHLWVCAHPLAEPGREDRMVTRYATSPDGLLAARGSPRCSASTR